MFRRNNYSSHYKIKVTFPKPAEVMLPDLHTSMPSGHNSRKNSELQLIVKNDDSLHTHEVINPAHKRPELAEIEKMKTAYCVLWRLCVL